MQFRRFAGHLRGSDLLLEVVAANLLETARKIPPRSERHDVLNQIGKLRIRLDALVSGQKKLPLCPSCGRGHEVGCC